MDINKAITHCHTFGRERVGDTKVRLQEEQEDAIKKPRIKLNRDLS